MVSYKFEKFAKATISTWMILSLCAIVLLIATALFALLRSTRGTNTLVKLVQYFLVSCQVIAGAVAGVCFAHVVILSSSYELLSEYQAMFVLPLAFAVGCFLATLVWALIDTIFRVTEKYIIYLVAYKSNERGGEMDESGVEMNELDTNQEQTETEQAEERSGETVVTVEEQESKRSFEWKKTIREEGKTTLGTLAKVVRSAFVINCGETDAKTSNRVLRSIGPVSLVIALLVLAAALLMSGLWGVHVSCAYCDHQELGAKTTRYERQQNPPFVCVDVCHSYVILPEDGSHSMIVVFHTADRPSSPGFVNVTEMESGNELGEIACAVIHVNMEEERYVSQCAIDGLSPGTIYAYSPSFVNGSGDIVRGESKYFRTLPSGVDDEIVFVVGGDLAVTSSYTNRLSQYAARKKPAFVGLAGDLTYDNGLHSCYYRWDQLVDMIEQHLVIPISKNANLSIPVTLVIGNHESGGYSIAIGSVPPMLFDYFPHSLADVQKRSLTTSQWVAEHLESDIRGPEAYHAHAIGSLGHMVALDTKQVTSMEHAAPQQQFIRESLAATDAQWRFAMYHVPIYPSSFASPDPSELRPFWEPLFLEGGIDVAFEHHEHCYKRTQILANDKADDSGIMYIGGGSWGVNPFLSKKRYWYTAKRQEARHFLTVTMSQERVMMEATNELGDVIDGVVMTKNNGEHSIEELCSKTYKCSTYTS